MSDLPADWAIEKVLKALPADCDVGSVVTQFARYIEAHEPAPVGRKLKCAREAAARWYDRNGWDDVPQEYRDGLHDDNLEQNLEAITLYEKGYGNDPLS